MNPNIKSNESDIILAQFSKIRDLVLEDYALNDAAHLIDHADTVAHACVYIVSHCNQYINPDFISNAIIACYCHDVQCHINRDNHHALAHSWVHRNSSIIKQLATQAVKLRDSDIKLIADACYEHRSSYKGTYSSIVSEIVSAADKGVPDISMDIYRRGYIFGRDNNGDSHEEAIEHAFNHIILKYGYGGYARYPDLYCDAFGPELEARKAWIAQRTIHEVEQAAVAWEIEFNQLCKNK